MRERIDFLLFNEFRINQWLQGSSGARLVQFTRSACSLDSIYIAMHFKRSGIEFGLVKYLSEYLTTNFVEQIFYLNWNLEGIFLKLRISSKLLNSRHYDSTERKLVEFMKHPPASISWHFIAWHSALISIVHSSQTVPSPYENKVCNWSST